MKCHVFISVNYRARLDEWNDPSGACASCTLWLLILLPLLPGDSDLVELDGGASWFCLGLGARDALFPRAPSEYSLLGESLVGERIFSGFGGGGLSRSENKSRSIIQSVNESIDYCSLLSWQDPRFLLLRRQNTHFRGQTIRQKSHARGQAIPPAAQSNRWRC